MFKSENLSVLTYKKNFTFWHYITDDDNVLEEGYFPTSEKAFLRTDDIIICQSGSTQFGNKTEHLIVLVTDDRVTVSPILQQTSQSSNTTKQNLRTHVWKNEQTYIGAKIIKAVPMSRSAYNIYKGWQIPKNENGNDDGYLVKYDNTYESWCPKEVFERYYRPITHQEHTFVIEA